MIIYPMLRNNNGIRVRDLREYLSYIPDEVDGEDTIVWLQSGKGLSSTAKVAQRCDSSDIILIYREEDM